MPGKTYALLVGITAYNPKITLGNEEAFFPRLTGCINDALKIKAFLQKNYLDESLLVKELYNEDAAKENVCNGFLEHLGQAGEGDAVLFYFSGHGTQEWADECFASETDNRLESLVCYYGNDAQANTSLLADKELRYLIKKISANNPHITVILDCCHSGDATRNAEIVSINYEGPVEKKSKGAYAFRQREWKNFIFHDLFSAEEVKQKGLNNLLPEGNHLLFSASESNESAYEIAGGGIFTKHLTTCLDTTHGLLSNQMLFDRLALQMKYAYVQKPRLYTPVQGEKLKESGFLDTRGFSTAGNAFASYNPKKGWILNRGEINGLYRGLEKINLVNKEDPSQLLEARIKTLEIDHALLELPAGADTRTTYLANLDYLARKAVKLYLSLDSAIPKDALTLLDALNGLPVYEVDIISQESEADYVLQHLNGMYFLTGKHDLYRPVSSIVLCPDFKELTGQLKHLSSWKFIKELTRTLDEKQVQQHYLQIEYALGEEAYSKPDFKNGTADIEIKDWLYPNDYYSTTVWIRLTNNAPYELYVGLLYLDVNFSSTTFLLEPSPYHLNPGEQVNLHIQGDAGLPVQFYPQALVYNYERYVEHFKIVVSDKPFEIYPLKLESLPEPPLPGGGIPMGVEDAVRRGGIGRPKPLTGWFTATINIVNVNPAYNKLSAERLREMLEDDVTMPFAEGLFFTAAAPDTAPDEAMLGDVELKPEITVEDTAPAGGEVRGKGTVVDIANWWARRKRNKYYKEIVRRFPERTQIVSEGDSWFQHPLVYDIIDHLSKVYAICCVAAAADTLSNYFSGEVERGDYFLDVLRKNKPAFFLISGGGNDILGSQFRGFLADDPYSQELRNSEDGSRFLKESFALQIDKLMNIYETIFGLLKTELPHMKTVVHGYDYPVHLDYPNKGWLGRYMIEKGISEPADRRMVIRYIMDTFNERLSGVAEKFPGTVYYLDVRNTVHFKGGEIDEWYDEIHPNNEGFQLIALKFIKLIESLKNESDLA